jgi:dTDP-4-dehydrorhamnose reductase
MRLFVTGSRGQLGRALERAAPGSGHDFVGADLPELDICDRSAVHRAVVAAQPSVIVNCAAFTAVDAAEAHEAEALAVNGDAVAALAAEANACGALLVQLSTDYVFDGETQRPYSEHERPNPLSAYGRTKLAGERAASAAAHHLVVRTAWLYGEGRNFVETIRHQLSTGNRRLRVVSDQTGSPTFAGDLAAVLLELIERRTEGVIHAVNSGFTTWYGLACEIVRLVGADAEVEPIATRETARPAPRPRNSALDTARLVHVLGHAMPPWQDALARYLGDGAERSARRTFAK